MLHPDFEQDRPTSVEVDAFWDMEVFMVDDAVGPAVAAVVDEIRGRGQGAECYFTAAKFPSHPTLHWFVSRHRYNEIAFVEHYLACEAFRAQASAVSDGGLDLSEYDGTPWMTAPFVFDGEVAALLVSLGLEDEKLAKELGVACAQELIQGRYGETSLFATHSAWSEWFNETPWDNTWIGVDKRTLRVWSLITTAPWPG